MSKDKVVTWHRRFLLAIGCIVLGLVVLLLFGANAVTSVVGNVLFVIAFFLVLSCAVAPSKAYELFTLGNRRRARR